MKYAHITGWGKYVPQRVMTNDDLAKLVDVGTKAAVIRTYELAKAAAFTVRKPPRTTWRGTPLHELWLEDPDGNAIEVYARLTDEELAGKPADLEPMALA